jgi:predicted nucleotidyltransferase
VGGLPGSYSNPPSHFIKGAILVLEVPSMLLHGAMAILKAAMPELRERYAVKNLAIFGSVARNEAGPDSDIDLLVEFEPGRAGGYFFSTSSRTSKPVFISGLMWSPPMP